jgi:hypothetical protein
LYNGDDLDDDSSLESDSEMQQQQPQQQPPLTTTQSAQTTSKTLTNDQQQQPLTVNVTLLTNTNTNTNSTLTNSLLSNNTTNNTNNNNILKSKVNPFMPSAIKPRMSFERRRWAHIFPLRSDGTPILPNWTPQQHDLKTTHLTHDHDFFYLIDNIENNNNNNNMMMKMMMPSPSMRVSPSTTFSSSSSSNNNKKLKMDQNILRLNSGTMVPFFSGGGASYNTKKIAIINKESYGGSSENAFSIGLAAAAAAAADAENGNDDFGLNSFGSGASMKRGVAWKSLTIPACLPLTTDYCPNKQQWNRNYSLLSTYKLILGMKFFSNLKVNI